MAKDLRFDVSALDKASQTFARMGAAVERFEKRLDRLDGKKVDVEVEVKTDQAEREVGRFATDTRRKLEAALANLPEIEIDANSTDADRKLADIRRRMQELTDKQIGVDLSAEEAIAESRALQRELEQLARTSPNVQVQVDSAAAAAKLAEIDAQVGRLDGKRVELKIDVDKSISETLIQVAQLGRALGALALPAGIVAAVPQIAALGAAALTAVGAVGLLPAVAGAAGLAVGTLSTGMAHFSDALGETDTAAKAKKVAEALAALSPAARSAAEAVRALQPVWAEIGRGVQDTLFNGVTEKIQSLSGIYFPILGDAMGRVAEHFNAAGLDVARFFEKAETVSTVKAMFSDFENTLENLAPAVAPLVSALTDVGAVGSSILLELSQGAEGAATEFMLFVSRARESGQLEGWIRQGITAVGQLGSITGNVGSILVSVFQAGEEASGSFLENVDQVTGRIADFFNTAQGQDTLVGLFRGINETVGALLPGLRDLGLAVVYVISALGSSGVFTGFATALSSILSAAAPVVAILGALASVVLPPLLAIVSALAPVLVPLALGFLALRAAQNGLDRFRSMTEGLGQVRDRAAGAVTPLRQLGDQMRVQRALAQQAGESHRALSGSLAAMATNQNAAIAATGRFGLAMGESYRGASTAVQSFATTAGDAAERATVALGDRMANGISRGVEGVISGVSRTADALRRLPAAAADAGRSLRTSLETGVIRVQETLRALPADVRSAAATLRTGLGVAAINAGERLQDLRDRVTDTASTIRTGIGVAAIDAAQKLRQLPAAASSAGSTLRTAIGVAAIDAGQKLQQLGSSAVTTADRLKTGLQAGVTSAVAAVKQLPTAAVEAGRSLATGLRTGVADATAVVRQLPTAVGQSVRETVSTIGTGMRSAGEAAANGLRTIPDAARSAFSSLGGAVNTAIGHVGRLAGSLAGAGTSIGSGLMRAGGSLVGFLGGPWGVAFAVAGAALSIFAGKQQEAAAKAQEHKASLDALNGTLDTFSGEITQATVNEKAKQLAQDGSLDTLRRLNVSTGDYTQASLGNEEALGRVTKQLGDQTRAGIENSNAYKGNREQLAAMGLTLDDLTLAAMGYAPAQDKVNDAITRSSTAGPEARAANEMLRDSLYKAGGDAAVMAQKLGISVDEVKKMQEATRSAATASQDFQNSLKGLTPALSGIKDGVMPTQALANGLRDLSGSAQLAAQGAGEAAAKLGGVDAGAKAAAGSMQQSRDAFVAAATSAGMTSEQANALANQIGLIPSAAETSFRTNATGVAAEMNTLNAQIKAVPAGKDVLVQALTQEAEANLTGLGFKVERMKDGTVRITANTDAARASLDAFTAGAANKKAKVTIDGNTTPADQSLAAVLRAIQAGKGTVQIDGNDVPVQQALAFVKGAIGQTKGEVQIGATKAPADQVLSAYISAVNSGSGTVTVNGQTVPADQALAALVRAIETPANKPVGADTAGGQSSVAGLQGTATAPATKPIGGDNSGGLSANELLNGAVGTGATKPIGGDPSGANAANSTVNSSVRTEAVKPMGGNAAGANSVNSGVNRAVETTATKPINASDGGARSVVNSFIGWVAGLVATVTVVANKIGFSGGGIMPMEHGGLIPMANGGGNGMPREFQGNRLNPMNTTAQVVRPKTYRVVGDRAAGDELYLPLVPSSGFSQAMLQVGAQRMGKEVVPAGTVARMNTVAQRYQAVQARTAMTPMAEGGMVTAARAIVARMNSRQQLFEDLTWRGAPAVVGQYNDDLLNARDRAGYGRDTKRFLEDYIRRNTAVAAPKATVAPSAAQMKAQVQAVQAAKAAAPTVTVQTGLDVAELRAIHAQLVGLRGDLLTSGQWGPEMVEQLRGLSSRILRDVSATARAAVGRDLSAMGAW